jgi:uncharacterized protein YacL
MAGDPGRQLRSPILTNDYNLNRAGAGVTVLNVNELAAVRRSCCPANH